MALPDHWCELHTSLFFFAVHFISLNLSWVYCNKLRVFWVLGNLEMWRTYSSKNIELIWEIGIGKIVVHRQLKPQQFEPILVVVFNVIFDILYQNIASTIFQMFSMVNSRIPKFANWQLLSSGTLLGAGGSNYLLFALSARRLGPSFDQFSFLPFQMVKVFDPSEDIVSCRRTPGVESLKFLPNTCHGQHLNVPGHTLIFSRKW